jgi:hypothetical protein
MIPTPPLSPTAVFRKMLLLNVVFFGRDCKETPTFQKMNLEQLLSIVIRGV